MITLQECPRHTHNYMIFQAVRSFQRRKSCDATCQKNGSDLVWHRKNHEIRHKWVLILCSGCFSAEEQHQTFILGIWEVQREVTQYGHLTTASGVVPAAHLVLEKNLGWAQVSGKSLPRRTRAFPLKINCVGCCTTWLFNRKDWRRQHSWKCCPSWGQNKLQ